MHQITGFLRPWWASVGWALECSSFISCLYAHLITTLTQTEFTLECSAPSPLWVLSLPHRLGELLFIYLFFNSLSMQECSLSFHKQIWDKCRKLERSVKCQHKGRKRIGIGRVAAVRIAAALCRQLRAIHSHLWALKAPKMETNFTGFIQGNKLGIYTFKHVINWLWIEFVKN